MANLNEQQNRPFFKHERTGLFYVDLSVTDRQDTAEKSYHKKNPCAFHMHTKIQLEDIFTSTNQEERQIDRAMMVGGAGLGKSTITQKIVHSWADDKMWTDQFDMVVHLRCRDLTDESYSLEKILMKALISDTLCTKEEEEEERKFITEHINVMKERILIIVDGLDELPSGTAHDRRYEVITEEATASDIVISLVNGWVMNGVKILATTRPLDILEKEDSTSVFDVQRSIVVLGFNEESISNCMAVICNNDDGKHKKIMEHLKTHLELYNLCSIPFMCVLLGTYIVDECLARGKPIEVSSMIHLLLKGIKHLTESRNRQHFKMNGGELKIKEPCRKHMKRIAQLASFGILGQKLKIVFGSNELESVGIENKNMVNIGLLEVSSGNTDWGSVETYSFIHLMIQEFFAAVQLCLHWNQEEISKIAWVDPSSRRFDNVQLCMTALLGDEKMGHQFLMALDDSSKDRKALGQKYSDRAKELIISMRKSNRPQSLDASRLVKLQMIRCAHAGRTTDEDVLERIQRYVARGGELYMSRIPGGLLPHQLAAIRWFIEQTKLLEGQQMKYLLQS